MAVAIPNYAYSYKRKGKPVFAPNSIGRRIGREVKKEVEANYRFDPIYYHLRKGGHVAAMHYHRDSAYFSKIDIANFFYSISRRRVQSALDRIGIGNARFYAKWSTVANPFSAPSYALPYGFVQSPILASLVVATADLGVHLNSLPNGVKVAVYVDDISLSSDDPNLLKEAFDATLAALEADGFSASINKSRPPALAVDIFNCDLSHERASVQDSRIAEFLAAMPTQEAQEAFEAYCASVENGNK